jgi:glycolate oxidase iron-sulfur subunit
LNRSYRWAIVEGEFASATGGVAPPALATLNYEKCRTDAAEIIGEAALRQSREGLFTTGSTGMSTSLPQVPHDTYDKFNACVHCGLCLPACPTYLETMDEADSPRGRIHLMKALVDGRIQVGEGKGDSAFEHLDRCLVCRACETACPSGVVYHVLIEAVRPQVAAAVLGEGKRLRSSTLQWMVDNVLPYPKRAAAAMVSLKLARKVGLGSAAKRVAGWMGDTMGSMADMVAVDQRADDLPSFTPAIGEHRGAVLFLRGCVGSVVSAGVNAACVHVLARNGFDVKLLADESCCGALAAHANDPQAAKRFGERLVATLSSTGDVPIISAIAGCGAQLKDLGHVVGTDAAAAVARRVRDISEFLVHAGFRPPTGRLERAVTYHDPCHLVHGQRVASAPRTLLESIPGLTLLPLPESDICCGAAGTYVLNQPAMAASLGKRKTAHILATRATELVTANIGCAMQIARHLADAGHPRMPVRHVVELLAESYDRS